MNGTVVVEHANDNAERCLNEVIAAEGFESYDVTLTMASGKGDNYLGVIHRCRVEGLKVDDKKPARLDVILKSAPSYVRDKVAIDIFYKRECYAYSHVLPGLSRLQDEHAITEERMRFKHAKLYKCDSTNLQELLVMEDFGVQGFRMADRKVSLTYDQMRLTLSTLAAFHALSFAMKRHRPEEFAVYTANIYDLAEYTDMFEQFITIVMNKAGEAIDDADHKAKVTEFSKDAFRKMIGYISSGEIAPYTVLCHGDCWINNMLFKYDDNGKPVDVRLLDWQLLKHSSPVVDISYLMFSSTDEVLRGEHYHELLDIYYTTLCKHLVMLDCDPNVCYPENVYRSQIKSIMPFGLIMAFITAPMFLSEADDVPDMAELLKKETFSEEDLIVNNVKTKERFERRIRGVVGDFVKFDLL